MHFSAPPSSAQQPITRAALLLLLNSLQAHIQDPAALRPIPAPLLPLVPPLRAAEANHRVGYTRPRPPRYAAMLAGPDPCSGAGAAHESEEKTAITQTRLSLKTNCQASPSARGPSRAPVRPLPQWHTRATHHGAPHHPGTPGRGHASAQAPPLAHPTPPIGRRRRARPTHHGARPHPGTPGRGQPRASPAPTPGPRRPLVGGSFAAAVSPPGGGGVRRGGRGAGMSEARLRPGRGPGGARDPQDKVRSGPGGREGAAGTGGTGEHRGAWGLYAAGSRRPAMRPLCGPRAAPRSGNLPLVWFIRSCRSTSRPRGCFEERPRSAEIWA